MKLNPVYNSAYNDSAIFNLTLSFQLYVSSSLLINAYIHTAILAFPNLQNIIYLHTYLRSLYNLGNDTITVIPSH